MVASQCGFGCPIDANTTWWSITRWMGTGLSVLRSTTSTLIFVMKPSTFGVSTKLNCWRTSYGLSSTG